MKEIELDGDREEGLRRFALVAPLLEEGLSSSDIYCIIETAEVAK